MLTIYDNPKLFEGKHFTILISGNNHTVFLVKNSHRATSFRTCFNQNGRPFSSIDVGLMNMETMDFEFVDVRIERYATNIQVSVKNNNFK